MSFSFEQKFTTVLLTVIFVLILLPLSVIAAPTETLPRIAGKNRYSTAVDIARIGWPEGAPAVILARSDNITDALTSIPLAYKLDAPVLLTSSDALSIETSNELRRLNPHVVYILGGHGAISSEVEDELSEMFSVVRIGGENRFETAVKIAGIVAPEGAKTVIIVNGYSWPDALSVAPIAAVEGAPILLNGTADLHPTTQAAIRNLNPTRVVLVGGAKAIGNYVDAGLSKYNVVRIAGDNRYSTAIELIRYFNPNYDSVYFASGLDGSSGLDAIAGAALAAKNKSPLLLVGSNLSATASQFIKDSSIVDAVLFGGTGAVSTQAETQIRNALSEPDISLDSLWPYTGATDYYPRYTYLTIYFSQDMANLDSAALDKVLLFAENGELVPVAKVLVGSSAKEAILVIPDRELALNTHHRLFIPSKTLVSAEGIFFPRTIDISFKTAHTVIRGVIQDMPSITKPDEIYLVLKGDSISYSISHNPDGVFMLTNVEAGNYTLEVYNVNNKKLYSQPIKIKTGEIYRPVIILG